MRIGKVHRRATARRTLWPVVLLVLVNLVYSGPIGAPISPAPSATGHASPVLSSAAAPSAPIGPLPSATQTGSVVTYPTASNAPGPAADPQRPGSDFTTYLGNVEHTSNISGEVLLNLSTLPQLQPLWKFETMNATRGEAGGVQSQAVELNGTVYFGAQDGYEYAVNATTGHQVWATYLGLDHNDTGCASYYGIVGVVSTPTIVGSTLYVGGGDSQLYALNAATGSVLWQKVIGGSDSAGFFVWSSPLIYDGSVYIGISAECGEPHVGAGLDQISLSGSHPLLNFFNTSVTQKNGSSIWGSASLNPATNTIFLPTGNPGKDPTASTYSESILALNATTLALKDQFQVPVAQRILDGDFGVSPTVFTPAGGPPMVTAINKNGILYAFYQSNLTVMWEQNVTSPYGRISTSFGGGLLYAMGQATIIGGVHYPGSIRAFDPINGTIVWADGFTQKPYNTYGAPVYVNGIVIVGDNNLLLFINAQTGVVLRSIGYTQTIEPPISVARGEVFVGDNNGNETAYEVPSASVPEYSITGTVQSSGGQALSGASVSYFSGNTTLTAYTNLSGGFQIDVINGTYLLTANDSGYQPVNRSVTVTGASRSAGVFVLRLLPSNLRVARPSATPAHPYVGEATTLSVTVTGATPPEVFIWSGLPTGCTSVNASSFTCTPRASGLFVVYATVNDSAGTPVQSPGLNLSVSPIYAATFVGSGLAAGTNWSVVLNGSAQSSNTTALTFSEPNGTYAFSIGAVAGYTVGPASGNLTVNGTNVSEPIVFTAVSQPLYSATFTESGLASGASWEVSLSGTPGSSTNPTVTFTEGNGTYGFSIGAVAGYTADPSSGSVTISGANASQAISFVAVVVHPEYAVTFTENGLPAATTWTVTLNGTTHTSTNATVGFTEQNGTFDFSVGAVTGYTVAPSSGLVGVNGGPAVAGVTFTAVAPPPPKNATSSSPTFLGLPATEGYALLGVLLAIIVVAAVVTILARRRGRTPPETPESPPPGAVDGPPPPP
jgi:outer membrane protein assembly factor BamB